MSLRYYATGNIVDLTGYGSVRLVTWAGNDRASVFTAVGKVNWRQRK
jgi:hypothetical protein